MNEITCINWPDRGLSFLYPSGSMPGVERTRPLNTIIIDDDENMRGTIEAESGLDCSAGGPGIYNQEDVAEVFGTADSVVINTSFEEGRGLTLPAGLGPVIVIVNTTADACGQWAERAVAARDSRGSGVYIYADRKKLPKELRHLLITADV